MPIAEKLSLTGIPKKAVSSRVNSSRTVDVLVANVKSKGVNCEHDLPKIYCVAELPDIKSSLPDSLEIDKYPHLNDVEIYAIDRNRCDMCHDHRC